MLAQLPQFLRYLSWSLEFLLVPPFLFFSVPAFFSLLILTRRQKVLARPIETRTWLLPLVVFLIFVSTLIIGVRGRVDWQQNPFPGPNTRGIRECEILALSSLATGVYWIFLMKGTRWFALSFTIFQFLMLASANFVAQMSLTGRWL
jgi:hypothetical protein